VERSKGCVFSISVVVCHLNRMWGYKVWEMKQSATCSQ
jgi:hypothetical protein